MDIGHRTYREGFQKKRLCRFATTPTSLKWLTVAMPLLEPSERLERETRERWLMAYHRLL